MRIIFTLLGILAFSHVFAQTTLQHKFNFGMNYVIGEPDIDLDGFSYDKTNDDFISLKFDYIASFRLNDHVSLGPGVGIRHLIFLGNTGGLNYHDDSYDLYSNKIESHLAIPVFLNVNARFINKKVSPFLSISAGYSFAVSGHESSEGASTYVSNLKSGILANANTGVNIRFRNGMNLSAGPYFEFQPTKIESIQKTINENPTNYEGGSTYIASSVMDYKLYHIGLQVAFAF